LESKQGLELLWCTRTYEIPRLKQGIQVRGVGPR